MLLTKIAILYCVAALGGVAEKYIAELNRAILGLGSKKSTELD